MAESSNGPLARLLFLHAQTGLHPGSGTALGTVDLPVQRERHTGWPTIPGSALKGILRDRCREHAKSKPDHGGSRRKANDDKELAAAFGPGSIDQGSNAHAGALSFTDARILAFPVRSLRGVFAWITCPAVLQRLARDLSLVGQASLGDVPAVNGENDALCPDGSPLVVEGKHLVLEEFEFKVTGPPGAAAAWVAGHASADAGTCARLRTHLVMLGENCFTHFVKNATEVMARVGLDYDTKTVKDGALFYQELLPPETLFYSVVLANSSRSANHDGSADEMLGYLARQLTPHAILQIGGDETTGKGLCIAHLSNGKGA